MILHRAPQGSPDWHAARAGCITASKFHLVRRSARLKSGPNKGDFNSAAHDYAFSVAVERISGRPLDEGFETFYMRRGHELEPVARMEREIRTGVTVEPVGFITTDDGKFGASADGFVGNDEGDEYKCFTSPEKLRAIYLSGDTSEVIDQCDGGMWITGRKVWNFALYCPALEPLGLDMVIHRIERDDDRINELEQDLIEFERLVTQYELKLRDRAAGGLISTLASARSAVRAASPAPAAAAPIPSPAAAPRHAAIEIPADIFG